MADLEEASRGGTGQQEGQRMLEVAAQFDDAYFNGDADALKALLADHAVLRADQLVTDIERTGPVDVARFFGKYFSNYKFKHFPVVRAVNVASRSVYCLWDDEDVIQKPESFDEQLPASGSVTSLSGIWRLVLDEQLKIRDIWFLRQLTREEKKYRLKHRPSQLYCDFHAKSLVGPTLDLTDRQVAKMRAAAEAFNEAWHTGDASAVHNLLAPTAHTVNPVFGDKKNSREEWEQMIQDVFQWFKPERNEVDIACTPSSNKAFIFWRVHGVQKDTQQEQDLFGLNLLVFDPREMLITDIVGFRQPLVSERDHIIKAGSYQERLADAGTPVAEQ